MSEVQRTSIERFQFDKTIVLIPLIIIAGAAANFMPELSVAIIAGLFFAYFWNHKEQLVIFLIIYTPFEELVLKMLPNSLYAPVRYLWEALLFGFILLMLFEKGILKRSWKKSPIDLLILVFISGWFISGFVNNVSLWDSLANVKNLIRYIPLFYIAYNLKLSENTLSKIPQIIILIALIQSFILFGQVLDAGFAALFAPREVTIGDQLIRGEDVQLGSYYTTRFIGTLVRNVHLGNYLAFALCFLTAVYIKVKRDRWLIAAFAIIFSALVICSSKMSLISAIVGIGVILIVAKHKLRRTYFISLIAAVMLFAIFRGAMTVGDVNADFNVISRLTYVSSSDYIETISSVGRLYAIIYAMPAVFMNSPIFGIGPGSFIRISAQTSYNEAFGKASDLGLEPAALRYVHDVGYAALFIQSGLIGLGLMIWIFAKIFRLTKRTYYQQTEPSAGAFLLGATGLFAALAIQNFACYNLMYRNQSMLVWSIAGLAALLAARSKSADNKESII